MSTSAWNKSAPAEYWAWASMIQRCTNVKNPNYFRYGGRGITVCSQWFSFKKFMVDVGPRPSGKYSIDRVDNSGNYEPGNVRWATRAQQMSNTRATRKVTIDGEERTTTEWATLKGFA